MTWSRFDDAAAHHPKAVIAGNEAWGLWVAAVMHCNRYLTDGFVSDVELPAVLPVRISAARAQKLAQSLRDARVGGSPHGLFERDEARGGWIVHDFLDWNPSKVQVEAKREKDRQRKDAERNPNGVRVDRRRTDDGQATDSARSPSGVRADGTRTEGGVRVDSPAPAGGGAPAPVPSPAQPSPADQELPPMSPPAAAGGNEPEGDPWGLTPTGAKPDAPASQPPPPTGSRKPRATQPRTVKRLLPDDWAPKDAHREEARRLGVDCDEQAQRMRDWAAAKGARYVDWDAMFRNWLRTSAERRSSPRGHPPPQPNGPPPNTPGGLQVERMVFRD